MISINNIIQNSSKSEIIEQPQARTYNERQIRAGEAVNKLFDRIFAILPAARVNIERNNPFNPTKAIGDTKAEWVAEILENSLTQKMVEIGLNKTRKRSNPFMPSVGEFIDLCRPTDEDLGIPSMDSAYTEACQHTRGKKPEDYSHVIVYEAGKMTGFFELVSSPEKSMKPKFKEKYTHLREKLLRGEEINIVSNAIEDKSNEEQADNRTKEEKEAARKSAAKAALSGLRVIMK